MGGGGGRVGGHLDPPSMISQMVAHVSNFGYLITFDNRNQVLIKNCCYGDSRFTTCPPYSRHLGFFKNFIFSKTAANFLEISRKYVFTASNRNKV